MVASLPRNIQLKLDQTLNQWRQWRCNPPLEGPPLALTPLGSGISNHSILVEAGQLFVIRIDGAQAANNGLSRSNEWHALKMAHDAGLAPCPRYYNPELGALVCDYLAPDNSHSAELAETAALLRAIHSLPGCHHRLDLRDRISRYERQLTQLGLELPAVMAASRGEILFLLDKLAEEQAPQVLCHNDLLAANRIYSENRLWAIDWEYSAMGSPWFDLAVLAIGDCLSVREQQELARAYLQRPANSDENLMFSRFCSVYRYLELLWYLSNKPSSTDLNARLAHLRDGLISV